MRILHAILFNAILLIGLVAFAASPEEFLQTQKLIRVYVDKAPGFGHQSAGISVMKRLRDLGFQGEFEVIYQPAVAGKIQKIYPAFPEGIPGKVHYVDVDKYAHMAMMSQVPKVELAISGADDGYGAVFSKVANADKYLRLQPLGWGPGAVIEGDKLSVLPSMNDLALVNLPTANTESILKSLPEMKDISEDGKRFVERFAAVSESHFNFPVYGIGTQIFAPQRLFFYGKAAKSAASKLDSSKAIIVPVVSPFNAQEMDTFSKVFGKKAGFESSNATELKHQKQMHLLSPQEFADLSTLKPGHVYFVFVGSVPQTVFNFFYEKANMPVWVAGKNAMSFAMTKGKPYFNTVNDYYLPAKETLSAEALKILTNAHNSFDVGYQKFVNQTELTSVSRYIQAAATPGSEIAEYYRALGSKLSSNDRVLEGLRLITGGSINQCSKIFQ